MKLRVLVENNTYIDNYYFGEPGICLYIEDNDKKILLDVGYSDIFIKNAEKMNIDLESIDKIVLSHGHDDHTLGLKYYFDNLKNTNIEMIAHPDAVKRKTYMGEDICSPYLKDELDELCKLTLTKEPLMITDNILFLGEIPSLNDFEKRKVIGKQHENSEIIDDYIYDDSALVYKSDEGLYIITGCSHSGICNIIEYAKRVCNDDRIKGVIGGLHLFKVDEQVKKTVQYLSDNKIEELYPCHCTSFYVQSEIHNSIPIKEVGVGLEIEWK